MKMNWIVRVKNKTFWITVIPAIIILIQVVASVFNVSIDLSLMEGKLLQIVDAVFVLLSILGIAIDHTTAGIGDSGLAMTYSEPKVNGEE